MIREDVACHDEATCVAFCEESVKFSFTHPRSLQGVQFIEPSPICFIPQIHAPTFDCGFGDRRVVEICSAIQKRLDDGAFSPTCLSICPFQGPRVLTNLRVVEAQRRHNFAGFWFGLSTFMCERKMELCDKPLGGYLLIGTPILVYNLSNGTGSV